MREIKFRAWDNVMDRMYHVGEEEDIVFELTGGNFIAVDITEDEDEFATLHHLEYMQYTGLKDKNGREIYEGDVYSYELYKVFVSGGHVEEMTEKSVDVVEFRDGAFCHGEELLADVLEWDESVKYEGNIYENPEILGEFSE